jgi:hypothetical protein
LLAAFVEGLRGWDRLLAFLVVALEVAFLALFRVLVVLLLAERRRAGFSDVAGAAARPSPRLLASWDRYSE